jgi:formimidoylglutamate deiminase
VTIGQDGRIASVTAGQPAQGHRAGILLPAPVNVHSHSFQRAMAGMTEHRGPDPRDTFWTWRQLMFRFLDHLTPDHVEAFAAFTQMEMLEAGYATNVEFHYLHHQPGGAPYANLAEMSERIASAAVQSGIGLTLLPVLYQVGGCDGRPLGPGQIRFGNTPDRYAALLEHAGSLRATLPGDTQFGVAPHSLRAVSRGGLTAAVDLAAGGPIHMHLAEQVAEVDEVRHAYGKRPVEWLLDNAPVDQRWCLIHCTQMERSETLGLAATGAVAGLCPITESNLGDGIFDGVAWMNTDGRIAVGSDSNIRISLNEELRTLDYSQRLRDLSRAALATSVQSTGRRLFQAVVEGGAQAAGRHAGAIRPGAWADLLALDGTSVDLDSRTGDAVLDAFVFAAGDRCVHDVWAAGRHMVRKGRHIRNAEITTRYRNALASLRDAI